MGQTVVGTRIRLAVGTAARGGLEGRAHARRRHEARRLRRRVLDRPRAASPRAVHPRHRGAQRRASSGRSSVRVRRRPPARRAGQRLVTRPEVSPTAGPKPAASRASARARPRRADRRPGIANANADFAAFLQEYDDFDRYADKETQASRASDSLRGLVQMLAPIPGRKTVVLVFRRPVRHQRLGGTMAATARRSQPPQRQFYTFDAVGLRVQSQQAEMARVIGPEGGSSFREGCTATGWSGAPRRCLAARPMDWPSSHMATGGQYISNSNNLSGAFASVNQDRRSYYMLSYSSTNAALDGSFRSISVKVHGRASPSARGAATSPRRRSSARSSRIRGRRGRRPTETPQPASFPFRLQAFSTPMPGQPGLVALVASLEGVRADVQPGQHDVALQR